MTPAFRELISNLAQSEADSAAELIAQRVINLALQYHWSEQERRDVGDLACDVRRITQETMMELVLDVMRQAGKNV